MWDESVCPLLAWARAGLGCFGTRQWVWLEGQEGRSKTERLAFGSLVLDYKIPTALEKRGSRRVNIYAIALNGVWGRGGRGKLGLGKKELG